MSLNCYFSSIKPKFWVYSKGVTSVQVHNLILNTGRNSNLICLRIMLFAVVESEAVAIQKLVCVCVCVCVYTYICMYVCIYIYISKGKVHPRTVHRGGGHKGVDYNSTLPSTSALDGDGWSTRGSRRFTPRKDRVPMVHQGLSGMVR